MTPHDRSTLLKQLAHAAGFALAGVTDLVPGLGADRLDPWLAAGKHGEMAYMARHRDIRLDPTRLLPGAKSVLMVGLAYRTQPPQPPLGTGQARISRYAWGNSDYHTILRSKLRQIRDHYIEHEPAARCRAVVDSAPFLERDYAQRAGLGWLGKNTLLLNRQLGSEFFLGGLLLDQEIEPDPPHETAHCGTCTACLDACPTQAFDGPGDLDARRCLSYVTIEHQTEVPSPLREQVGDWLFGCDVCQDVCPWVQKAARRSSPVVADDSPFQPAAGRNPVDLAWLLALDEAGFQHAFAGTPLERTGRARVLRNAALVAAAQQATALVPVLQPLTADPDPMLAATARWALDRLQRADQTDRLVRGDRCSPDDEPERCSPDDEPERS